MCCGKNRTAVSQARVASPTRPAAETPAGYPLRQRNKVAYFEYTGKTALTVLGRAPIDPETIRGLTGLAAAATDRAA